MYLKRPRIIMVVGKVRGFQVVSVKLNVADGLPVVNRAGLDEKQQVKSEK